MGYEGTRMKGNKDEGIKQSKRVPVGKFYKTATAIEERLSETVGNINSTDDNSKLLNSVKGMPSCKISKFSARVNEEGEVCIDESMVEHEPSTINTTTKNPDGPILSYANMQTGHQVQVCQQEGSGGYARALIELEYETKLTDSVKVWYQRVEGSEEKFVNIDVEFENVPDKCDHCMVFGHSFKNCRLRPRTEDEKNKEAHLNREGTVHKIPNQFNGQQNNRSNHHRNLANAGYHGRRRGPGSVQVKDRNIQQTKKHNAQPESSKSKGNREACNLMEMNITGENGQPKHMQTEDNPLDLPSRVKPRKPLISVIETANRYTLLDEDGNTIEENRENNESVNNDSGIPKSLNAGWIKKQERRLNSRYSSLVNQEQRFEAKKYVLEKLVPIQSVLSGWPIYLLEYFRLLCILHNFGDGYMAAASERDYLEDQVINGMQNNGTPMEEVESETDAMASLMKNDNLETHHVVSKFVSSQVHESK
ncbi:hypothetical protein L1987_73060 [Smallanthus sonchifolius]|uniref:Uncharacterized protein n=1 Tax=Smallanthus sonchifolius TaxID=185202 RepID=A0ACB8ZZ79_9ASTR|nr:hypothetical protein L1987_73060 [Smallanthus sonchifolius]